MCLTQSQTRQPNLSLPPGSSLDLVRKEAAKVAALLFSPDPSGRACDDGLFVDQRRGAIQTANVGGTKMTAQTQTSFAMGSAKAAPVPPLSQQKRQQQQLDGAGEATAEEAPQLTAKQHRRHFVRHDYTDHAFEVDDGIGIARPRRNNPPAADCRHHASRKDGEGATMPFPDKLHDMLDGVERDDEAAAAGLADVVSWRPHGRAFVVRDSKRFVSDVMPLYFRQSKISSFQRQLNLYGFRRLTRGPDRGAYYHELFLRGKRFLCRRMVRTRVKGTGIKASSSPETEPDFYSMPPLDGSASMEGIPVQGCPPHQSSLPPPSVPFPPFATAAAAAGIGVSLDAPSSPSGVAQQGQGQQRHRMPRAKEFIHEHFPPSIAAAEHHSHTRPQLSRLNVVPPPSNSTSPLVAAAPSLAVPRVRHNPFAARPVVATSATTKTAPIDMNTSKASRIVSLDHNEDGDGYQYRQQRQEGPNHAQSTTRTGAMRNEGKVEGIKYRHAGLRDDHDGFIDFDDFVAFGGQTFHPMAGGEPTIEPIAAAAPMAAAAAASVGGGIGGGDFPSPPCCPGGHVGGGTTSVPMAASMAMSSQRMAMEDDRHHGEVVVAGGVVRPPTVGGGLFEFDVVEAERKDGEAMDAFFSHFELSPVLLDEMEMMTDDDACLGDMLDRIVDTY